jgi:hypothetical protein
LSPEAPSTVPTALQETADEHETDWICPPGSVALGASAYLHTRPVAAEAGAAAAPAKMTTAATAQAVSLVPAALWILGDFHRRIASSYRSARLA